MGYPAITKFGELASQGDEAAADTLAKMAPGVDGVTAEVYSNAIALWAKEKNNHLDPNLILATCLENLVYK